ncbi:MAG TPA: hypothetical protein VJG32_15470 [Anaerolineae bacterium]|nr:hypothetical protein [Anaerolineae bacterium]
MQVVQTQAAPSRMTLQQARCVVWPFNKNRGLAGRRIGDLLDAGLLSKHDLQWASTNAHSSGIQAACSVILSTSLEAGLSKQPVGARHVIRESDPGVESPDQPPNAVRSVRWQDLIPEAYEPAYAGRSETREHDVPNPAPIPETCPICGSAVRPNHPWDTVRRLGWLCEQGGTAHFLHDGWERVKGWFFREYIIPPSDDGSYPGIRRGEMATAATHPCGYLPDCNK